jgi:hypothetical protein
MCIVDLLEMKIEPRQDPADPRLTGFSLQIFSGGFAHYVEQFVERYFVHVDKDVLVRSPRVCQNASDRGPSVTFVDDCRL